MLFLDQTDLKSTHPVVQHFVYCKWVFMRHVSSATPPPAGDMIESQTEETTYTKNYKVKHLLNTKKKIVLFSLVFEFSGMRQVFFMSVSEKLKHLISY